jgi:hypothetical protein
MVKLIREETVTFLPHVYKSQKKSANRMSLSTFIPGLPNLLCIHFFGHVVFLTAAFLDSPISFVCGIALNEKTRYKWTLS